jgi:hypothetical protein
MELSSLALSSLAFHNNHFSRWKEMEMRAETGTFDVIVRELSDQELQDVAGGNPFSGSSVFGTGNINSGSFAIGAVFGDLSSAPFGSFAGQVNTFGTNFA